MAADDQNKSIGISRTRGSILLIGARALTALFNIFSVPIYLALLGKEGYAAIVYAMVIHSFMGLFDFGAGEIFQRRISVAISGGKIDEVDELNRDQMSLAAVSGLVIVGIGAAIGMLVSLDEAGISREQTVWIFVLLGAASAVFRINQTMSTLLSALQRFDKMSLASALTGFCTTAFGLTAIYFTQQVWTYMAALLAGECVSLAYFAHLRSRLRLSTALPLALRSSRIRPILKLCIVETPNRIASYFSGFGDKLMLGMANVKLDLMDYRNAARVPDSIWLMLFASTITSLPKFSRDLSVSHEKLSESTLSSGRIAFLVSASVLIAPTAFAGPFLSVWLGRNAPRDGATIMVLIAIYQALQIYVAVIGYALFALEKRHLFIPITATNALISVLATIPIYNLFGIVGVAYMNCYIALGQMIGVWVVLWRLNFPHKQLRLHALQVVSILVISIIVVFMGREFWVWQGSSLHPWVLLFLAPAATVIAVTVSRTLKVAYLPGPIEKRLTSFFRRSR